MLPSLSWGYIAGNQLNTDWTSRSRYSRALEAMTPPNSCQDPKAKNLRQKSAPKSAPAGSRVRAALTSCTVTWMIE